MKYRDRVVGLIRVTPERIDLNEGNWRTHDDDQRGAMRGVLGDIGIGDGLKAVPADEAKVREVIALKGAEREAWLREFESDMAHVRLLDGHMRAGEIRNQPVPIVVLDLLPHEEAEFLATFDPLGALAGRNAQKLDETMRQFNSTNAAVQALVAQLAGEQEAATGGPVDVVDVSDLGAEFYLSARGPMPSQPDAIDRLREALESLPGVVVSVGMVGR